MIPTIDSLVPIGE